MNLFIGNLNPETTITNLRAIFTEFGEIVSAKIIYDNATGMSRGFGFIEMADRFHAFDAIDNIDSTFFEGNIISVKEAKQNNSKPGGGKPFNKARSPRPGGFSGQPRPAGGTYQPRPAGGTYQPRPAGGTYQPRPSGGTYQPRPAGGNYQPRPANGDYQPRPADGNFQPRPADSSNYQPRPEDSYNRPKPSAYDGDDKFNSTSSDSDADQQ